MESLQCSAVPLLLLPHDQFRSSHEPHLRQGTLLLHVCVCVCVCVCVYFCIAGICGGNKIKGKKYIIYLRGNLLGIIHYFQHFASVQRVR